MKGGGDQGTGGQYAGCWCCCHASCVGAGGTGCPAHSACGGSGGGGCGSGPPNWGLDSRQPRGHSGPWRRQSRVWKIGRLGEGVEMAI
jgi:hypothetical protein